MIEVKELFVELGDFRLDNINVAINKNEFFVLMGPTGAGKTVLLEAIAGLIPVRKGSIYIGGKNVTTLPPVKKGRGHSISGLLPFSAYDG